MRKNFGAKTWLYPMPVLIVGTYGENGTPNAMNAAWGGVSEEKEITICFHRQLCNGEYSRALRLRRYRFG